MAMKFYGAKTLYKHNAPPKFGKKWVYEERIVLIGAHNADEAIKQAELEANNYSKKEKTIVYLNFVNVFEIFDRKISSGSEVYSIMRSEDLIDDEYIDRYYDTGTEHIKNESDDDINLQPLEWS